jgi:hypothetical protein
MTLPEWIKDETKQILNLLPALVFFTDAQGTVLWMNKLCTELLEPKEFISGMITIDELFPYEREDFLHEICSAASSGESKNGIIERIDTPHSGTKTLKFSIIPSKNQFGEIHHFILFALDITGQLEMNQLKQNAYEQIEKNIEQFATLGDHLRNPITVIAMLCNMIDDKEISSKILGRTKEIDQVITQMDKGWIDSEKIRSILKKYYDVGIKDTHELVARAIHDEYIAAQQKAELTSQSNPSMKPWNELPSHLQDANLKQADDIWKKLNAIHCVIGLSTGSSEPLFEFAPEEIELLAQQEHIRWTDELMKRGWVYGIKTNDKLKVHDCLIPWELVPEYQKEKDRNAIQMLPSILAKVNLKIIRLN